MVVTPITLTAQVLKRLLIAVHFQAYRKPQPSLSIPSGTPLGWGWLSAPLLLQENAAEWLMDLHRVGMETASAAIHKLHSFQLLAVCY